MRNRRVLIDASNLVVGGGVQVGASVVDEILKMQSDQVSLARWPWLNSVRIEASPEVLANTTSPGVATQVIEIPRRSRARRIRPRSGDYDVSFVVFGPLYDAPRTKFTIMGFADGISLHPETALVRHLHEKVFLQIRSRVSRELFSRAGMIIAESTHVASSLHEIWHIETSRLKVLPNVINAVFFEPALQSEVTPIHSIIPTLAFPARAYPHKNLAILGRAGVAYRQLYGEEVRFALTLTPEEWRSLSDSTRRHSFNVGPLKISQIPSFLRQCRGTIFPSLLESFSVTPLEALAVGSPLLASDRDFVRSVVGDCAEYFDPVDPESVARAIRRVLTQPDGSRISRGRDLIAGWPSAAARAEQYVKLIDGANIE